MPNTVVCTRAPPYTPHPTPHTLHIIDPPVEPVPWLVRIAAQPGVAEALSRCDEWDFDVFELDKATNGASRVLVRGKVDYPP